MGSRRGKAHMYTYSNCLFVTLAIPVLQKERQTELFFELNANANYSWGQANSSVQQHSQKKDVHPSETSSKTFLLRWSNHKAKQKANYSIQFCCHLLTDLKRMQQLACFQSIQHPFFHKPDASFQCQCASRQNPVFTDMSVN